MPSCVASVLPPTSWMTRLSAVDPDVSVTSMPVPDSSMLSGESQFLSAGRRGVVDGVDDLVERGVAGEVDGRRLSGAVLQFNLPGLGDPLAAVQVAQAAPS